MIESKDFEKAIDGIYQFGEYDRRDRNCQTAKKNTEAAAACFALATQMRVDFAGWLADKQNIYSPQWDGKWCSIERDDITPEQLVKEFEQWQKTQP